MTKKFTALIGCQVQPCAESYSLHLDMVRLWNAAPICEECYLEETAGGDEEEITEWNELPKIGLEDLQV